MKYKILNNKNEILKITNRLMRFTKIKGQGSLKHKKIYQKTRIPTFEGGFKLTKSRGLQFFNRSSENYILGSVLKIEILGKKSWHLIEAKV